MDVATPAFETQIIRKQFPILRESVHGKPFVFLDSAASAQKPDCVIDAMADTMRHQYANIHRGLHWMSERTTEAYEASRAQVARFLGVGDRREIVFVRNSTEAINLVAHSFGDLLQPGQAVLISEMEHHANIVPWQMLRDRRGIELRVAPITDAGDIDMARYEALLADGKVGLVAITHMSNVLGTVTPAPILAEIAHRHGARILLDGSQSAVHSPIDLATLGADFFVCTGHKLYGPTGIGVLWARRELLEAMSPFLGGGDMIETVSFERSTWASIPQKFEAGTPAIIEAIGLGAALSFMEAIGMDAIAAHEASLTQYALDVLDDLDFVQIIGAPARRGGVISFICDGAHPHDLATLLDQQGIAVRAGQHCAEPLLRRLGLTATTRASFGIYTTTQDIDALAQGLKRARTLLI
ncbi:cysteine desulfurase [Neoasaia chiangmaiensis NBRC 101099]|uniref:cysteine desulfurase n=1 Tax=Neoasaia chiangmaiensis TaxID=320497 RepID=A0A1U9KMR1_9PROT|nr:cysteine desulfurase [Neoasaia chiangmaiensis]AQS87081.1 cysteine desulfurase [Neoasaia chiangmaiensis]GBR38002.1 cysteine desulfurase [Neoasaia chiangmaiensis NBRC 101099]GEN15225.1 cysteine desulfurase [Neoasaia chiangmaiensis]